MLKSAVTILDVARVAGVSKSAVSIALTGNGRLSEDTKTMILQVAGEMGFEPNSNARRLQSKGLSNSVGLFTLDLDLSVGTRKIKAIRRLLTKQSFDVPIHSCSYQYDGHLSNTVREMRLLCQQRPRAIICNTTDLPVEVLSAFQGYRADGGVLVCYDRPVNVECDQVVFDREDNTYQAAKHLLELGHRGIGFFEGGRLEPTSARVQGLTRALAEFGLQPKAEWLFGSACYGEFEDDGVKMATYFLDLPQKPSAVCIVNDYAALAFISEVQRAGLSVPEDVSVVGHDDRPVARYCNVPLTSVSQPVDAIAQSVVDLLLERLNGDCEAPFRQQTLRGELVVRQSTRAFS